MGFGTYMHQNCTPFVATTVQIFIFQCGHHVQVESLAIDLGVWSLYPILLEQTVDPWAIVRSVASTASFSELCRG